MINQQLLQNVEMDWSKLKMKKSTIKIDNLFKHICLCCGIMVLLIVAGFFIQLMWASSAAWNKFGLGFITSSGWDPAAEKFGALPSIIGTLVTTFIALLISLPLAFAASIFIVDAPKKISVILGYAVDLLAAIPSVIYGMWGLFILAPLMQKYIQPFMINILHMDKIPFVTHNYNGFGLFTAGVILAIMILPYICAVIRDVLQMTPPVLKEAAYGIGCTKLEAHKDIILRYGIRGILGGIFIGLGRALGETMAVLFVIGNIMNIPKGIFDSATTISSTLANNFAEADGLQRSVLFALGFILLLMCLSIQLISQGFLHVTKSQRGER